MRAVSARAAREGDEAYEAFWPRLTSDSPAPRQQSSALSTTLFGIVLVTAVILGASGEKIGTAVAATKQPNGTWSVTGFLRGQGVVKYREEFTSLKDWAGTGNDWSLRDGLARPGRLRVWDPSTRMADYQFEFGGQIEKRAMSWAYRATDLQNYYATKIVVSTVGRMPRAELVRYMVSDGKAGARTTLPLPMLVQTDTVYRVQVNVRGDSFSTMLNGQVVDSWSDPKLRKGGVGFFSDPGEISLVSWASVTSRDHALGNLLSSFGLATPLAPRPF